MALKIRLKRMGRKKAPHYRIVIAESSMPRDGRFVTSIGFYNPTTKPATLKVDRDKALSWIAKGAVATDTVQSLLKKSGVFKPAPTGVEAVTAPVSGAAGSAAKAVKGAASKAAGAAKGAAKTVSDIAETVVDRVQDVAGNVTETVVDQVQDVAGNVAEAAGDIAESLVDKIKGAAESVVDAVKGDDEDEKA